MRSAIELATNPITRVDKNAPAGQSPIASYKTVLRNPWARIVLLTVGLEGALFQGIFPYISADLHLRFGLSFTAIGIIIGVFATGGLVYAATVRPLMRRLGQSGIANVGGVLMGLSFAHACCEPVWHFAPFATLGVGLGFFMLHNTLQTEGTQMAPAGARHRGRAVRLDVFPRPDGGRGACGAGDGPLRRAAAVRLCAVLLPALALWFTRRLKRRAISAAHLPSLFRKRCTAR